MKEEDKKKLEEAEEKKKKEMEEAKNDAKAMIRMGQEPNTKGMKGAGAKGKNARSDMEEYLHEVVDDLKAELRERDLEFEHMREKFEALQKTN